MRFLVMKRIFLRSMVGLALLCLTKVGLGAENGGFPETLAIAGTELRLQGQGDFHYWWFHLYDGALYLPAGSSGEAVLEAAPKHLELHYHRKIPASRIVEAGNTVLRRNLSPEEWQSISPELATINEAYRTVREGDRYSLSFHPEQGTVLALNGETLATVPGETFARLYFRIWFGESPVSETLRDRLRGVDGRP